MSGIEVSRRRAPEGSDGARDASPENRRPTKEKRPAASFGLGSARVTNWRCRTGRWGEGGDESHRGRNSEGERLHGRLYGITEKINTEFSGQFPRPLVRTPVLQIKWLVRNVSGFGRFLVYRIVQDGAEIMQSRVKLCQKRAKNDRIKGHFGTCFSKACQVSQMLSSAIRLRGGRRREGRQKAKSLPRAGRRGKEQNK
jgi:hypothetical protein